MGEIAKSLARLGLVRVKKGEPLNVRRREKVRRALGRLSERMGWAEAAALSEDPVQVAATDVRKVLRRGIRSLRREIDREIEAKKAEAAQLEALLEEVRVLSEDPPAEFPGEIEFSRTVKSPTAGLVTRPETLSVADEEEARKAARSVEKSLPRWDKLRLEMLEELRQSREQLGTLSKSSSDVVQGWQTLVDEVLVTSR